MAKTKKPTGLSIARSGNVYALKWKIGGSDYANGQQLAYRLNNGAWTAVSVGVTAVSAALTLSNVRTLVFRARGNQKKKIKKSNPGWSDWATSGAWTATIPKVPELTYENQTVNSGKFSWKAETNNTNTEVFTEVQAQTCTLTRNGEPMESEWGAVMSKTAEDSQTVTEETEVLAETNLVRWYRVRSAGPAGVSEWATVSHAYGTPTQVVLDSASAVTMGSVSRITAAWRASYDELSPIDLITLQYVIASPTDAAFTPPASGWTDAVEVTPNGGNDKVVVNVSAVIGTDECMWVRVLCNHDTNPSYSNELLAQVGTLAAPTISATPNTTTGAVSVTITTATSCTAACTAIFCRLEDDPSNDRIIGVMPYGTTTATYTVPEIVGDNYTCFGAFAFVGTYTGTTINAGMRSASAIDSNLLIVAPAVVTLADGPSDGTVRIGWEWTWDDATQAELAWADHEEAWESTDEPNKYKVTDALATSWVIAGLDTGVWYFRVRLINASSDNEIVGPWSETYTYNLSSVPDKPALTLSKSVINANDSITVRWAYSSADGSPQAYAEIRLEDGTIIAHTETGQSLEITHDWVTGQTYSLSIRTTSESGIQSDWSEPATLYIAEPLTITLTDSLTNGVLTAMPLTATVTGAGSTGVTALSIVRAEDYHIYRPDENDYDGYAGETIATVSQIGEAAITITTDNLTGSLDDGAQYTLIATIRDDFGQSATVSESFTVDWTHKADVPGVTVVMDKYMRYAKITPIAPEGYATGDTCDIYRITADKPELVYKGATFGTTYVDPYPGFGQACGHRLVTVTPNGDYASATGLAWYDADSEDGDILEEQQMIVTVDGQQIELPYNLSLSNRWTKDFKRTSYLGGSVQGDWNPAVTRDLTANTVLVRGDDLDRQLAMRDLAGYAGIAHVRTPDGSSLTADVQIEEQQSYDDRKVSYTMTIAAIDPQEPAGMTLDEWYELHPIGGGI